VHRTIRIGLMFLALQNVSTHAQDTAPSAYELFQRAVAELGKNEVDQALQDFSEAIRIDSQSAALYSARALAYEAKGKLDDAAADYSSALKLAPNDAANYTRRAQIELVQQQFASALEDLEKAKSLAPDDCKVSALIAIAKEVNGKPEDASKEIDSYVKAHSTSPEAYWARLQFNLFRGEYLSAAADAKQCISEGDSLYADRCAIFGRLSQLLMPKETKLDDSFEAHFDGRDAGNDRDWPLQAFRFLSQDISKEKFLKITSESMSSLKRRRDCEAAYYIAIVALSGGKIAEALKELEGCLAVPVLDCPEFLAASALRNRLVKK
jgi:tetratricopeptide (TPR) repeat protein